MREGSSGWIGARTFRPLKTVALEIRPVYHQLDERIEAHVFLCMLAYYVQWHMQQKLVPLFEKNEAGKDRRWTWAVVLERLMSIRRQTVRQNVPMPSGMQDTTITITSCPDDEQQTLLNLLDATT